MNEGDLRSLMHSAALVLLLFLSPLVMGGQVATLRNGFQIQADRIERSGSKIVLFNSDGQIELEASQVESVETYETNPTPVVTPPSPQEIGETKPIVARPVRDIVTETAERYGLPPEFVRSVARVESNFQNEAISPKGARGVMQLMPETAKTLGVDPGHTEQNIEGGTRLLRELLLKYQNEPNPVRKALAAYNAGEGAVARHGGVPPYRETREYVEKVLRHYWHEMKQR